MRRLELSRSSNMEPTMRLPENLKELKVIEASSLDAIRLPGSLEVLDFSGSEMSSLSDLTRLHSLKMLDLSRSKVSTLDGVELPWGSVKSDNSWTPIKSLDQIKFSNRVTT